MPQGFTKMEILIVGSVFVLLLTLSALSLLSSRAFQRDAVRLSTIRQIQSGLEDYANEKGMYPEGEALSLGDAEHVWCLSVNGFRSDCSKESRFILRAIPSVPTAGLAGLSQCGDMNNDAYCYFGIDNGKTYRMQFELEKAFTEVGLVKGANCASPEGMTAGPCR